MIPFSTRLAAILTLSLLPCSLEAAACPAVQKVGPAAEEEARQALERAAEHASKGRYRRARDSFKRIVFHWPETRAGREAKRRLADNSFFSWSDVVRNGPSEARIDVVFLGEGYTFDQQDAFDDVAADLPRLFERSPVFGEYFTYFNFLRGNVVSLEAGVDGFGRSASTALGGAVLDYTNAGNATVDHGRVRDVLQNIPGSEGLAVVVVKRGNAGTGGNGVATIGRNDTRILLHEWGHAFASLGDEYAVDQGFRHKIASTRVNVSVTEDEEEVPWAHWIAAGTPGIGTYEGAAGQVRDVWRPKASGCIMNDGQLFFCEPCREAIVLSIYERLDPILAGKTIRPRSRCHHRGSAAFGHYQRLK